MEEQNTSIYILEIFCLILYQISLDWNVESVSELQPLIAYNFHNGNFPCGCDKILKHF